MRTTLGLALQERRETRHRTLSETEPAISGLRETVAGNGCVEKFDLGGASRPTGGPLTLAALGSPDGGSAMRPTLLALIFATLTSVMASACPYHMTTAQGDQTQPAQTAQAQPAPAQYK
jgi:hypothetical protein